MLCIVLFHGREKTSDVTSMHTRFWSVVRFNVLEITLDVDIVSTRRQGFLYCVVLALPLLSFVVILILQRFLWSANILTK